MVKSKEVGESQNKYVSWCFSNLIFTIQESKLLAERTVITRFNEMRDFTLATTAHALHGSTVTDVLGNNGYE